MTRVKYEILKCNFSFSWVCISEHRFTIHKPYLCYPESTPTYYKQKQRFRNYAVKSNENLDTKAYSEI